MQCLWDCTEWINRTWNSAIYVVEFIGIQTILLLNHSQESGTYSKLSTSQSVLIFCVEIMIVCICWICLDYDDILIFHLIYLFLIEITIMIKFNLSKKNIYIMIKFKLSAMQQNILCLVIEIFFSHVLTNWTEKKKKKLLCNDRMKF